MKEVRKILNIYGNRGYNNGSISYTHKSMLRGYGALSSYIEKLQKVNANFVVHSTSFSEYELDKVKVILLTVLYSGELTNILNAEQDAGFDPLVQEGHEYKNVDEYDSNGYNRILRLLL